MKPAVRSAYEAALARAREARADGDLDAALLALERAHILGQRHLVPHIATHVHMLRVGLARSDAREVRGQVTRLLATVPGWLTGWVPKGNPGSVRVSAVAPMPLTGDLAELLHDFSVWRDVAWRAGIVAAALAVAAIVWR